MESWRSRDDLDWHCRVRARLINSQPQAARGAAIVTYAASTKDELKPGAVVFINNPAKKDDGTFEAAAVMGSRGGVNPPPM